MKKKFNTSQKFHQDYRPCETFSSNNGHNLYLHHLLIVLNFSLCFQLIIELPIYLLWQISLVYDDVSYVISFQIFLCFWLFEVHYSSATNLVCLPLDDWQDLPNIKIENAEYSMEKAPSSVMLISDYCQNLSDFNLQHRIVIKVMASLLLSDTINFQEVFDF